MHEAHNEEEKKNKTTDIKTKETKVSKSQSLSQLKLKQSHFIQDK